MRLDKLTHKAREALAGAQENAAARGQQAVEVEHLLLALVTQEGGLVAPLVEKIGVPPGALQKQIEAAAARLPKVSGGEPYLSSALNKLLLEAQKEADQ